MHWIHKKRRKNTQQQKIMALAKWMEKYKNGPAECSSKNSNAAGIKLNNSENNKKYLRRHSSHELFHPDILMAPKINNNDHQGVGRGDCESEIVEKIHKSKTEVQLSVSKFKIL